jgi:C_GCAxxG_C_C family probable redox protein
MNSSESDFRFSNNTVQNKINRRKFISKSAGCTAGLTLLAFPGIITEVLAQKGDKSKEEILKELEEKVNKNMQKYGACSQASFCSLNQQFELKGEDTARALKQFAGGIAGRGETCGAVSGSLLALGLFFEPPEQKWSEQGDTPFEYAGKFFNKFQEEFGSTRCSEVVEHQYGRKYDFLKPEDRKLFMDAAKSGKCTEVVKKAVLAAADLILENS